MPHAYSEDQLVEQPAIELFESLGWSTVSAVSEELGLGGTLGRVTKGEVVLRPRLRAALVKLNPAVPEAGIQGAMDELLKDRSAMEPVAANREVYGLLKGKIKVPVKNQHGQEEIVSVKVIDWDDAEQNDFLAVRQITIVGSLYTRRPDMVGFVNGLPLVLLEFKEPGKPVYDAFANNLSDYKDTIPHLFPYNALIILSNGTDSRVGSMTADWNRFFEWKRIEREDETPRVSLEVVLRGICERGRLLDIVENFTLFSFKESKAVKILAQNHQYLGVNNAIQAMLASRRRGDGKAGVFWHTQGSGKSFSMIFYAQKILQKHTGDWRFVVVTDRTELDDQIAKDFVACGAVSEEAGKSCHATSGAHLRALLQGNNRYVFTLIHKFQTPDVLNESGDVIVLTDEAHRSQYETLAMNMRGALKNAQFIAFTGTPLIAGEERTRDIFGDYVSIYDFLQSVRDNATVRLYYENRTPELQLVNPELNEDIYQLIEEVGLDEDQEAKLEKLLGRQYHLLTRDDRLEKVAEDIVGHFLGRGFQGKAMVVSIDKVTALKMYEKVRHYWKLEGERVSQELAEPELADAKRAELLTRLDILESTDMAVVVSPEQNEIKKMAALGLDIEHHRRRMNAESLDEKFKDAADPLKLVFVCAMWLTGFDVPSCSTLYLDKPLRNHTLMQTIARANRVYPGKQSGLIVDYANVFASLEQALSIYGKGSAGAMPVRHKQELVEALETALNEAEAFCKGHKVPLADLAGVPAGSLLRLQLLGEAMNKVISPDQRRNEFFTLERLVHNVFTAVKPDPAALLYAARVEALATIAESIRAKLRPTESGSVQAVMEDINALLDLSITGVEMPEKPAPIVDLSQIDYDVLKAKFRQSARQNSDVETLKAMIRARIAKMAALNKSRLDYQDKFEQMIEAYNSGSLTIEQLFDDLLLLAQSLTVEEERHLRENLSEEELAIFDVLMKPAPELTAAERDEVKRVARELLETIKAELVISWRSKDSARANVEMKVEKVLDALPEAFSKELYELKCRTLFEHFYESYPDYNRSVYQRASGATDVSGARAH